MGDALSGIFGGGSRTTQTTEADPTSQSLNNLRLQQLQDLFGITPYSTLAYSNPSGAYTPSPEVGGLYSTAGLSDTSPITEGVTNALNEPIDRSSMMTLQDYIDLGMGASKNYMSQIATPSILSTGALSGLEGSGYIQEALAKAGAEYALPFIQGLPEASSTLSLIPGKQNLLKSENVASLAGVLNPYTSRDVGLSTRASNLFNFADYDRSLQEQDVLRQQGVVTTGLTGLPYTPGSQTTGRKSSQPLFNWFGQG